jgi:hypothetical protein
MQNKNFELKILVGGKPIHEYEHMGNYFVEGRKGSQFELEFKNNTGRRVLAVPSVDGRSVIDGQPATPDSMGYTVPPHGSVRIPGWRLDQNGIAAFVFEDKERSYAARTNNAQSSTRAGVVGMLVFDEKVQAINAPYQIQTTFIPTYTPTVTPWQPFWNSPPSYTFGTPGNPFDVMRGIGVNSISNNAVAGSAMNAASVSPTESLTSSMAANVQAEAAPAVEPVAKSTRRVQLNEKTGPFEMGTGFGPKSDFKTNEVKFNKGEQVAVLQIFYDSRRNLEKRGIQVVRSQRTYLEDLPSAFQSSGCTPPPGWEG